MIYAMFILVSRLDTNLPVGFKHDEYKSFRCKILPSLFDIDVIKHVM